ncbi:MAG: nitrogenase [Peptococcaceae bacterium]|nr:nitrogenase [Peptococcaceae bacterium]
MLKDVAVYVNELGETASLYDQGKIVIYHKVRDGWHIAREQEFSLDKSSGLKGMRQSMTAALAFLGDCKVLAGSAVAGIPYFELEKAGISVWEFAGQPEEFLDYIVAQEDIAAPTVETAIFPTWPSELEQGHFRMSLQDIQRSNVGFTTKQALLPFLRQGKFYSLEVICNHIPPWLETELLTGNLQAKVEQVAQNEVKVLITKRCS